MVVWGQQWKVTLLYGYMGAVCRERLGGALCRERLGGPVQGETRGPCAGRARSSVAGEGQ